jgi:murein DD-endopeptidase MepM/ murein hydrolase activator NlpD
LAHAEDVPSLITSGVTVTTDVVISSPTVVVEPYVCPVAKCVVLSKFGSRATPAPLAGKPPTERHEGIDLRVTPGQQIRAARSGRVIFAGFSKAYASRADKKDQQRLIIVSHADRQSTRYVHLNSIAVRPPQMVKAGDVLGTASESDEWAEPVLHFEVHAINGSLLNPEKYLGKR